MPESGEFGGCTAGHISQITADLDGTCVVRGQDQFAIVRRRGRDPCLGALGVNAFDQGTISIVVLDGKGTNGDAVNSKTLTLWYPP